MIKTHSIVSCEDGNACELRQGHQGVLVTYKGVTGWLIRYMTACEHHLVSLTVTEARECLALSSPEEEEL